jgi:hypothetical protein
VRQDHSMALLLQLEDLLDQFPVFYILCHLYQLSSCERS